MLDQLPTEIIHNIASHLPTASSIINLSLASRRLYAQVSADDYGTFRSFVQRNFPSIRTPPYWKEAACLLTTRSRAWERRAFVAKALEPPPDRLNPLYYERARGPSIGYAPIIDSYETWYGSKWGDKHEVLAWGAAGRLIVRLAESGSTTWHVHRVRNDHLPRNDILDVRLLRPKQRDARSGEQIILRRHDGHIAKHELDLGSNGFRERTLFDTMGLAAECMAVSGDAKPLVAACNSESLRIFDGTSEEKLAKPISILNIRQKAASKYRQRCATFLDSERLAMGTQYVEGQSVAPINIYRVTPDGSTTEQCLLSSSSYTSEKVHNRTNANVIVPLDDVLSLSGRTGDVFLSGWSDGVVRLYDTRAPTHPSIDFQDSVDHGQILSLLPIGHERFLAGSVENACLKTFDLRMPGAKVYSYLNASSPQPATSNSSRSTFPNKTACARQHGPIDDSVNRQLNIFLAVRTQCPMRLWQPLPRQSLINLPRYRGAIYSLSAPSSASPTVYAGIENHVIQLDFVSTDDIQKGRQNLSSFGLDVGRESKEQILNLSCYERPRPAHESTDTVLLRNQVTWNRSRLEDGITEDGWDERWRLATFDRRNTSWRRSNLSA